MRPPKRTGVALLAIVAAAAPISAHEPERIVNRELVRLQGQWIPAQGDEPPRVVTVTVLGEERRLSIRDWRAFAYSKVDTAAAAGEPRAISLQGERATLARLVAARPDQRLTLLAERRPGSTELFLLAADLCPEK
jgi:hypothetical protein